MQGLWQPFNEEQRADQRGEVTCPWLPRGGEPGFEPVTRRHSCPIICNDRVEHWLVSITVSRAGELRAIKNGLESHTDHFAADTAQVLQGAGEKSASARKPSQGRLAAVARGLEGGW